MNIIMYGRIVKKKSKCWSFKPSP